MPTAVLRRLGDYELLEEIARGGMGIVFRARQMSLNRGVAVKLMRDSALARPEDIKRFRAEAAAAAKLKHPNIVAIHEVGEQDGQHYFAMDLIEGPDLAKRTAASPLPSRTAAELAAKIADAVQHAHEQGLLHRDLKPSNVLVDADSEPFVTDFGIARSFDAASNLTQTDRLLGTPAYMAPEQADAHRGAVGPASDVYSLGALLHHMLTTRPPFVGDNVADLLRQVVLVEPLSPQLLNGSVPLDLVTICLKCLAKRPADRYASARELAEDLRRFLRQEPVRALPIGRFERLRRWRRREPAIAFSLAFAFLALLSGLGLSTWQWRRALAATHDRKEQLWQAQLLEARAYRISGKPGQRIKALEVLSRAIAYRPSVELRNEAIAALVLPDIGSNVWWHAEDNPIVPSAFTADLAFFVPVDDSGHIAVYRSADQTIVAEFDGLGPRTVWTQFSPDGRLIAVRHGNGDVGVWSWRERRLLFRAESWVTGPRFAPFDFTADGREFWVSGPSLDVARYSLPDGQQLSPPVGVRAFSLRLDRAGRRLLTTNRRTISAWDGRDGKLLMTWATQDEVDSLAWHPDGSHFTAAISEAGLFTGEIGQTNLVLVRGSDEGITSFEKMSFSRDGALVLTGGWGDHFGAWDFGTRKLLLQSPNARFLQLSADGLRIACYQERRGYGVREFAFPTAIRRSPVPARFGSTVNSGSWHPSGHWLATAHGSGWILWDGEKVQSVADFPLMFCQTVDFLKDGKGLLTCGADGPLLWPFEVVNGEPRVGEARRLLPNAEGGKERAALSPDGTRFAAVGAGGGFIGRLDGGSLVIRVPASHDDHFLAFSPDGQWLYTGHHHGQTVNIHDAQTGILATNLPTGMGIARFIPARNELVTEGPSELAYWSVGTWKLLRRVPKTSQDGGATVGFWPDGRAALFSTRDLSLRILGIGDVAEFATLTLPEGSSAWGAVFDPSATRVALTGGVPFLRIWRFPELRGELRRLGIDWPGGVLLTRLLDRAGYALRAREG